MAAQGCDFVPTKGGDGGAYVPRVRPRHWDDNGKVVLTGEQIAGSQREGFVASLVTTSDPSDRAHLERDPVAGVPRELDEAWVLADPGLLRSRYHGRTLPGELRRYHPSQVTSRGIAYDSMFDGAALTAAYLQRELGIDLGWRTGFPRPHRIEYAESELARARVFAGDPSEHGARRLVERRMKTRMTREEAELEREANRLLAGGHA